MNGYRKSLTFYKDYDLCRLGELYVIDPEDIPKEKMTSEIEDLFETGDEGLSIVRYMDVERLDLYEYADYFTFDKEERVYALSDILKAAPHYLVMARNCTWNGSSGYKVTDFAEDVLYRSYDVSIYPVAVSKGGKCLVCKELSHDVPMGSRTIIIALTDSECEYLEHWGRSWEEVEAFVRRHEAKAEGGVACA